MNQRFKILFYFGNTITELGAGVLFSDGELTCNTLLGVRVDLYHQTVDNLFSQLTSIIEYGILALELSPAP
jgi:hypothetical protein